MAVVRKFEKDTDDETMVLEFGPRNSFASAFHPTPSIASAIRLPIDRLEHPIS
jgi:hypothetical protein